MYDLNLVYVLLNVTDTPSVQYLKLASLHLEI